MKMIKFLFLSSEGRIGRKKFIISVIILLIFSSVGASILNLIVPYISALYIFFMAYCFVILCIKRCHDLDKPGYYMIRLGSFFNLYFTKGTRGDNQYGSDPLEL